MSITESDSVYNITCDRMQMQLLLSDMNLTSIRMRV